DRGWGEADLALVEWRHGNRLHDLVAASIDHADCAGVAVGDIEARTAFVPGESGGMATDGNHGSRATHQIHARHVARLCDAAGVHAHELRAWSTALLGGAVARTRLA